MSSITRMVLYVSGSDRRTMAQVNAWCAEQDTERQQQFERLDTERAGGTKIFSSEVWAMAGNYFPSWELSEALSTFDWYLPECVVLIVQGEDDDGARVYRATAGGGEQA